MRAPHRSWLSRRPQLSESIVGQGLVVEGKFEGNGSIRLAGRLKGQVVVTGDVTVDPNGAIEAT
jgi:cytoskeletal protein CcmA (bactofilin family)